MSDPADDASLGANAPWRLGHRPALDGVRGLAFLMVLLGHAGWPGPHKAHEFGVELFFVLSGLLITGVMLGERAGTGSIRLGQFYIRRARRLLPALFAMLAVLAVAGWLGFERWRATDAGLLGGLTYTTNFLKISGYDVGNLEHLWSLAVEEHFYFVWPVVLLLAAGRDPRVRSRAVLMVIVVLVLCSYAWREYLVFGISGTPADRLFPATELRASSPLVGAALAVILAWRRPRLTHWSFQWLGIIGLVILAAISIVMTGTTPTYWLVILPLSTISSLGILIAAVARRGVLVSLFSMRWLQWLGRHSYSGYLWHYPIFLGIGGRMTHLSTLETLSGIGLTLLVAAVSTRFIEQPFRHGHQPKPTPVLADA